MPASDSDPRSASAFMRPRQPLILVVDDDRDSRELYRACFDMSGYRTAEAETGEQALCATHAAAEAGLVGALALAGGGTPDSMRTRP